MSANEQLWCPVGGQDLIQAFPQLAERVNDVWNTLAWIEARDLGDIEPIGPVQPVLPNFATLPAEEVHVIIEIPITERLAKSIQPKNVLNIYINSKVFAHQSVLAPNNVNFSGGTSFGTNLFTG